MCGQEKTRLMGSNLRLLRRFFEYLDASGQGFIGVRELEEPLISVVRGTHSHTVSCSRACVVVTRCSASAAELHHSLAIGHVAFPLFLAVATRPHN
jgi:hypothetical protein